MNIAKFPRTKICPTSDRVQNTKTHISIFGLGYVGAVSAACFASCGHKVIGVDPMEVKIKAINEGKSPIVEDQLPELLEEAVAQGRLRALTDARVAVLCSDLTFVCVGTPSAPDGGCDLTFLKQASAEIGAALREKNDYHVVVFRSTVPPGTTQKIMLPIIEQASGKKAGEGFGLCFHPEFLRESTAVSDFFSPPKTVVGAFDEKSGRHLAELYDTIDDSVIITEIEVAEMVKYVDNTWHALKVSFANEIGNICQSADVDSHSVMDIFVQDTKLNLSPYYLKPGFAFGGSCLPKDVRSMNHMAQELGVATPVLNSIIASNEAQIAHAVDMIEATKARTIGFLGITFKPGTDDLRESPVLPMIAELLDRGRQILIFDPNLDMEASLRHHLLHSKHSKSKTGQLMKKLPDLVVSCVEDVIAGSDTIVVSHSDPQFEKAAANRPDHQNLIDLVRLFDAKGSTDKIKAAGMDGYLQKPIRSADVTKAVHKWVKGKSSSVPHLLLVEDNPVTRTVTKLMLEKSGFALDTASDGLDAVRAVQENDYDLVLMDITMPGLNGYQATQAIRPLAGKKGKVPIIALTAHAKPERARTYNGICW